MCSAYSAPYPQSREPNCQHPSVAAVAVIGLPDAERGERVCAVVELVPDAEPLTLAALQEHCDAVGLSRRKWPEQLEVIDAMPRNPTMKILKYQLAERFGKERFS